jgi:5-methylcytosine-specific restriction protein A
MTPREPGKRKSFAAIVSQNRSGDPFYCSAAWRALRLARLKIDGWLCCECRRLGRITEAKEVDHVLPRVTHPELELSIDNLESLCKPCHSRKTMREQHNGPGGG